jgi:hypothetical protein
MLDSDKSDVICQYGKNRTVQTQLPVRLHLGGVREASAGNALNLALLYLLIGVFSVEESWVRVPGHLPGRKAAWALATQTHISSRLKKE